ncbi:MAG: hypothetical protein M3N51_08545 [Actinomycetota bacterium]|nr:hypothetical protein [Actinomycetota bacterium]
MLGWYDLVAWWSITLYVTVLGTALVFYTPGSVSSETWRAATVSFLAWLLLVLMWLPVRG